MYFNPSFSLLFIQSLRDFLTTPGFVGGSCKKGQLTIVGAVVLVRLRKALKTFHPGQSISTSSNFVGHNLAIAKQRFTSSFRLVSCCSNHSTSCGPHKLTLRLNFLISPKFLIVSYVPEESRLLFFRYSLALWPLNHLVKVLPCHYVGTLPYW